MDQYTKGEVLGKGTFGVVIKATHKQVSIACHHGGMTQYCGPTLCVHLLGTKCCADSINAMLPQTGQVVAIKKINLGDVREVWATPSCAGGS